MRSMKLFGFAVVAACALGLAMGASAFASLQNPEFTVLNGTTEEVLTTSLGVTAKANGTQYLTSTLSGNLIECSTVGVESGAELLTGGKNEETLKYTGCGRTGKTLSECYVQGKGEPMGTITTTLLSSLLGYRTEAGAKADNLSAGTVTDFKPKSGTVFTTIELKGGSCGLAEGEHTVEGELVLLNVPPATHASTHELEGLDPTISEYWTDLSSKADKHKVSEFTVTGLLDTGGSYVGKSEVTATSEWGVGL